MSNWVRLPQEREGKHQFKSQIVLTTEVNAKLRPLEILAICRDIRGFVEENGGAYYFQVYQNEIGEKLYFIDQGPPENAMDVDVPEDELCCVLLYPHEY